MNSMKIIKNISADFKDERGDITRILDDGATTIKSVLLIRRLKGSVGANHYHKKDTHYCYFLSGKAEYYEKPVEGGEILHDIIEAGDMVFSPAMTTHAMKFLEDSVFIALATESRDQEDYESDTVRENII